MKRETAEYPLETVKALLGAGHLRLSAAGLAEAACLGLDFYGVAKAVLALEPDDFHLWLPVARGRKAGQDVYRLGTAAGEGFLKLAVLDEDVFVWVVRL